MSLHIFIIKRAVLFLLIILAISLTSFCGNDEQAYQDQALTEDEHYLVQAYVKVSDARDHLFTDPIVGDSLFARLDSTIDTLRITNTIEALNEAPDRWAFVFLEIEKALRNSSHRGNLEETRGSTGTAADVDNNDKDHE